MLAVGVDWAEEFHLVALGQPGESVFEVCRVEHSPRAVDALGERIAALEPDPAEVRVVLEARHGLLVERLLDAGYVVVPVNPDLIARRRGPAKKKDDAEDARIACLLALDRFQRLRPLIPHGELAGELRAIARDDDCAARDERRLLNRLRQDLLDHPEQFGSPNALQCYAGRAPVTRRSGKSELVVSCRLAYNRHLGDAAQQGAFCSLKRSTWAREFDDGQRARGKGHHAALHALGNRWLEVLWHCLHKGLLSHEAVHAANRKRTLEPLAQAA